MITAVPGVLVGHWSDPVGRTGCTVVLFPEGTVASGEVRGGAPGTREWELLHPDRLVSGIDAVVLCGGSAFGLAACDGVARWCEERGRGFATRAGRVPIVVGAVLYDLGVGDPRSRPGPEAGYAACQAASDSAVATGQVGAGTGATVAKWRGPAAARPGGVGGAALRHGDLVVGGLFVLNAFGQLLDPLGPPPPWPAEAPTEAPGSPISSTTIGVVATNARLNKAECRLLAQSAHDGMARALEPVHTRYDGDAVVAAATGRQAEGGVGRGVDAPLEQVRMLAARVTTAAIRAAASTPEP